MGRGFQSHLTGASIHSQEPTTCCCFPWLPTPCSLPSLLPPFLIFSPDYLPFFSRFCLPCLDFRCVRSRWEPWEAAFPPWRQLSGWRQRSLINQWCLRQGRQPLVSAEHRAASPAQSREDSAQPHMGGATLSHSPQAYQAHISSHRHGCSWTRHTGRERDRDRLNSFVLPNTNFLLSCKARSATRWPLNWMQRQYLFFWFFCFVLFWTEAVSVTPHQKAAVRLWNTN